MPVASDAHLARRAIALVLIMMMVVWGLAEVGVKYVLIPLSRIERRIDGEIAAAIRPPDGQRPELLLVGNSLLLFATQDSVLWRDLPSPWDLRRVVIEQDEFLDWRYTLPRLGEAGAQPRVVAVMLDPGQLTGNVLRGDYSFYRLLTARDAISIGRRAGLHPTEISRLLLSSGSTFYGFRKEMRSNLLGRIIPGMAPLSKFFQPGPASADVDTVAMRLRAKQRLLELNTVVHEMGGAELVLILPPLLHREAELRAVRNGAADAGVEVILAFAPGSYAPSEFIDGYHLNMAGSSRFMRELLPALDSTLGREVPNH